MNFEIVNTDWFSPVALRLPDYKVGRVSYGNGRSYIRINEDGGLEQPLRLYTSLTTAINTCAPMEQPLLEWYVKHGIQEAGRLLTMSQHYGTLMHLIFGRFLMEGSFDLSTLNEEVEQYTSQNNYWQPECSEWAHKLKYDLIAFVKFCQDYKVVPLGIEFILLSNRGYGTLIDLICYMTVEVDGFDESNPYKSGPRKGQPRECKVEKQITAVINFKSGRHNFYRSNGLQAIAEQQLFEENFPDIKIDGAFNWAPKDWSENPGYYLKDWVGEIDGKEIDAILQLAEVRFAQKAQSKRYINIYGTVHKNDPVSDLLHYESVQEYCERNYGNTPMDARNSKASIKQAVQNAPVKTQKVEYVSKGLPI